VWKTTDNHHFPYGRSRIIELPYLRKGAMWNSIMPQVARLLPNSSRVGKPPSFEIDNEGWKELEALVGPISADLRREIIKAIEGYLWTASAELAAAPLDQATRVVIRVQSDIAKARKMLSTPSTSDAEDLAYTLIGRNLHHPLILDDLNCEVKIEILADLLRAAEASCEQTISQIFSGEHSGRLPGRSWDGLIRTLTAIFKRNKLPTGARKDDDANAQQSPFVYVIDLLQTRFDQQYRHATQSLSALSVAISKARRVPKT